MGEGVEGRCQWGAREASVCAACVVRPRHSLSLKVEARRHSLSLKVEAKRHFLSSKVEAGATF